MDYQTAYLEWIQKAPGLKEALLSMEGDDERQRYCFEGELTFGTAGMRAEMDAGPNRMNEYTVARATLGLARYLKSVGGKTVAVSYDSRINSLAFAKAAASVFAWAGIKAFITPELQPAPVLSFIVRNLGADCGVMITASHNAKQYNGYKVYGPDGTQINGQTAAKVLEEIKKIDIFSTKFDQFDFYIQKGDILYVGENVVGEYTKAVLAQNYSPADGLTVAYSALNGAGHKLVPSVLTKIGAKVVKVVEQSFPNGNFTTCSSPNPENEEALTLGVKYASESGAQLLLATDPDCDRVGAVVLHDGKYVRLTGNETGFLLTDYIFSMKKAHKTLPEQPVIIKTIVTSGMADKIAADYGGKTVNLLTGFKYIGEYMTNMEKAGELANFVFAFEESCGYLAGTHVRDKDGVVACMLIAEMCAEYRRRGMTLIDRLNWLYHKFGRHHHKQVSYRFTPAGQEKTANRLKALRGKDIISMGGLKVLEKFDLLGEDLPTLPRSDVLIFNLEANAQMILRPSGTEPMLKIYLSVVGDRAEANMIFEHIKKCTDEFFA